MRHFAVPIAALAFVLAACDRPVAQPGPDEDVPPSAYVVVAADDLRAAADEFAAYRAAAGYVTTTFSVSDLVGGPQDDLVAAVHAALATARAAVAPSASTFLLLLGDAPARWEDASGQIPALPCENLEGDCQTDNAYADLDGDGLPEVAVGRVPARSLAQAEAYLAKLKAHESSYEPGPWNRRLAVYTGVGGFGPEVDALIELAFMEGLKHVSHAFDIVGAYDNPRSPFYYQPFLEKVIDLYNQGSLAVVYVGHGSAELDSEEADAIACAHRLPVAFFFSCGDGDYVGATDSVAETVLWKERGPIASVGASQGSHPYGNAIWAYEVARALLDTRPPTVGEAIRVTKRALLENDDEFRRFVDDLGVAEVPRDQQAVIRSQHVNLYNLFGDPAAALRYPATTVAFAPLAGSLRDGQLTVRGTAPGVGDGTARVTLEAERDVILEPLDPVDPDHPDTATVQANWEKAVDKVVVGVTVPVAGGAFQADLRWTPPLPGGAYYLKAYVEGTSGDGFGAVPVP